MSDEITTEEILDAISDEYTDQVDSETVEAELATYRQFDVPEREVRNGVLSKIAANIGLTAKELTGADSATGSGSGDAPLVTIDEIDTAEEWVTLEAEVVQLWEPNSDSIGQVGLLADSTGRIKFVAWEKSDLMMLAEGEQYRFENIVTDEYNDKMSVKLNASTDISFLDEEMDISNTTEVEGAFVALQSGSGLIKRCSEDDCSRPLGKQDRCSEHGHVEGEHDIRIKGVLDDGHQTYNIVINDNDLIERLTGVTLDDAKQQAMDALDPEVVANGMVPALVGRYFRAEGAALGDLIAVDELEPITDYPDTESLLVRARSM